MHSHLIVWPVSRESFWSGQGKQWFEAWRKGVQIKKYRVKQAGVEFEQRSRGWVPVGQAETGMALEWPDCPVDLSLGYLCTILIPFFRNPEIDLEGALAIIAPSLLQWGWAAGYAVIENQGSRVRQTAYWLLAQPSRDCATAFTSSLLASFLFHKMRDVIDSASKYIWGLNVVTLVKYFMLCLVMVQ